MTDISLEAVGDTKSAVRAHKLVLMAVSDYFRTMFKACFSESHEEKLTMPGSVQTVVKFHSGSSKI